MASGRFCVTMGEFDKFKEIISQKITEEREHGNLYEYHIDLRLLMKDIKSNRCMLITEIFYAIKEKFKLTGCKIDDDHIIFHS